MDRSEKVITSDKVATPEGRVKTSASEHQVEVVPGPRQGRMGQIMRAHAVIWFITAAVMILIAFRFGLMLLGANAESSFAGFIYAMSFPLVAPFASIFRAQPTYGSSALDVSTLVAFIVYPIVALGLTKTISLVMAPTDPSGEAYR